MKITETEDQFIVSIICILNYHLIQTLSLKSERIKTIQTAIIVKYCENLE